MILLVTDIMDLKANPIDRPLAPSSRPGWTG